MPWKIVGPAQSQDIKMAQQPQQVHAPGKWKIVGSVQPMQQQAQPPEFSWPRFLGEKGAKGAMGIVDLPQVVEGLANPEVDMMDLPGYDPVFQQQFNQGVERKPREMASEKIQGFLKRKGVDLNTQQPTTPLQRMAGVAADWTGGTIGGAGLGTLAKLGKMQKLGNVLGAPTASTLGGKASQVAKLTGAGTVGGTISGGLQEVGMPELASTLIGALGPGAIFRPKATGPKLSKAEKAAYKYLTKELGGEQQVQQLAQEAALAPRQSFDYSPTLAEVTTNPRIKELQRAVEEHPSFPRLKERKQRGQEQLAERLDQLAPNVHPEQTTQFLERLQGQAEKALETEVSALRNIETEMATGEKVQQSVAKEARKRVEKRQESTGPLYEKIEKMEGTVSPSSPVSYINEKIKNLAKGSDTRKYLEKAKNLMQRELSEAEKADLTTLENALPYVKDEYIKGKMHTADLGKLGQLTRKQIVQKINDMRDPSIAQLQAAKEEIGDAINKAKDSKQFKKAELLREVQTKLSESLESVPEIKEASKLYAIGSEPVNKIYEDPLIGKVLKTTKKGNVYKLGPSQVSTDVLKPSMRSADKADNLLNAIGKDKSTLETIKKYINNDLLGNVVDAETGKVSVAKLDAWKKANPYANKFYPGLDAKLANVERAQRFVTNVEKVNKRVLDGYYKEAASHSLMNRDSDLLFARVLNSKDKFRDFDELMTLVNKDKTGASKEGLKNSALKYTKNHVTLASGEISPKKLNNFLSKNQPILEKLLEEPQIRALQETAEIALRRQKVATERAAAGQSRTTPLADERKNILGLASDMTENGLVKLISKFSGIPGIGSAYKYIRELGKKQRTEDFLETMDKIFSNPKEAEILLSKPFENRQSMEKFIQKLKEKPPLVSPIITHIGREEENEKHKDTNKARTLIIPGEKDK